MPTQNAVVLGATGLIGGLLLQKLLNDDAFATITILVRKPVDIQHAKLKTIVTDFNNLEQFKANIDKPDVVFSCIGTTQKNVKGDNVLYTKIDFDIPTHAALFAKEAGCESFLIVSSVGANAKAKNFYLRLKGQVENAVSNSGINSVHIFQPSMLLGNRKEHRVGEGFLQTTIKALSVFFTGKLRKYKAIEAADVAVAMANAAKEPEPGIHFYVYDDIISLIKNKK
jgi:uncharacterized protein YbjT (DUF2867 family)